jgi:hypothetical protein
VFFQWAMLFVAREMITNLSRMHYSRWIVPFDWMHHELMKLKGVPLRIHDACRDALMSNCVVTCIIILFQLENDEWCERNIYEIRRIALLCLFLEFYKYIQIETSLYIAYSSQDSNYPAPFHTFTDTFIANTFPTSFLSKKNI